MQIEVQPQQDMRVLLVGYPPLHGLALAYLLSKAGIKAALLSSGSTRTAVQQTAAQQNLTPNHSRWRQHASSNEAEHGPSPHRFGPKLRLGYARNFERRLTQGRWSWVHIFTANAPRLEERAGRAGRIEQLARTSRRLGLYISLSMAGTGSSHTWLQKGILELLPLASYVGCTRRDAVRWFHSADSADVELKLRGLGFRGVGVTLREPSDVLCQLKTSRTRHISHLTLPGNLHGEAEWLISLIKAHLPGGSFLL